MQLNTSSFNRSFMFRRRQDIRCVAARVLLVWLFALGVGIVNAFVLKPGLEHGAAAAAHGGHDHATLPGSHDVHAPGRT